MIRIITAIAGSMLLALSPAVSAVTIYTDEAAFVTATTSTTHAFTNITPTGTNISLSMDGVTFGNTGGDDDRIFITDPEDGIRYPQRFLSFQANHFIGNTQTFTGSITGSFSAFGFNYGSYYGSSVATLSGNGFSTAINADTGTNQKFIGFVSDTGALGPIGVTFTGIVLNIVTFRTAVAVVPEPASWMLMIVGLGLAGAGLRRRQWRMPAIG